MVEGNCIVAVDEEVAATARLTCLGVVPGHVTIEGVYLRAYGEDEEDEAEAEADAQADERVLDHSSFDFD